MPQDTFNLPGNKTPKPKSTPSSSATTTPSTPTFHTNIPKKSFNKLIPVVIILVILAIAGIGTSIFFGIQNANQGTEIASLKEQINKNQNSTIIIDDEEIPETPSDQSTTITKAEILAEIPNNLGITSAKCLNCTADQNYNATAIMGTAMLYANISPADNLARIQFAWDAIKQYYSNLDISNTGFQSIDISLSGQVTDVFIARFGQAAGDETVLFLMEDGTVEYLPIYTAIKNNDFRSYGKIPELEGIVKFYTGNAIAANAMTGAGYQTLAQRADGKFYELYTLLKSTGNYDDSRWQ